MKEELSASTESWFIEQFEKIGELAAQRFDTLEEVEDIVCDINNILVDIDNKVVWIETGGVDPDDY